MQLLFWYWRQQIVVAGQLLYFYFGWWWHLFWHWRQKYLLLSWPATSFWHQQQQRLLRWLVATSFLALVATMAIAFMTGHFFLASTAATAIALAGGSLFFGIGWHWQQQLPLRWLLLASFLVLAATMAIAFMTDCFFLASMTAITIALAGGILFFGIDDDNGNCFCDQPFLFGINGINGYCVGWCWPLFRHWLTAMAATTIALAGVGIFFGIGGDNGYCFCVWPPLSNINNSHYFCDGPPPSGIHCSNFYSTSFVASMGADYSCQGNYYNFGWCLFRHWRWQRLLHSWSAASFWHQWQQLISLLWLVATLFLALVGADYSRQETTIT